MLYAMYTIVGFGMLLACLFEGEHPVWSICAGLLWPLVLARVLYVRITG